MISDTPPSSSDFADSVQEELLCGMVDRRPEILQENCVLACYPCNNAKSDVFSYEEFSEIGKAIHRVKIRLDEPRDYKTVDYFSSKMLSIDFGGIMK